MADKPPPAIKTKRMILLPQGKSKIIKAVDKGMPNSPDKDIILSFQHRHVIGVNSLKSASNLENKNPHDDDPDQNVKKDPKLDE